MAEHFARPHERVAQQQLVENGLVGGIEAGQGVLLPLYR